MLLQSPRAHCKAPGGPGSIWKYLEALVRATGVSGRFACGFRTELHSADAYVILFMILLNVSTTPGIVITRIATRAVVCAGCPRGGVVWISQRRWGTKFGFGNGYHSCSSPIILKL